MLEIEVDSANDLTVYRCSGHMTEEELTYILQSLYNGTPTMNILWDYTDASLAAISSEYVRQLYGKVQKLSTVRRGGKSALVASKEMEYGLGRMFQIMSDENGFPIKVKLFNSVDEARRWLTEKEE